MYFFLGHGRNSKGCMMILAERAFGHYYSTFEKSLDPSADVCGVGDCARLVLTLSDPRETSGPRIDRIPLALADHFGIVSAVNKKITFLRPPVSVPSITLDQYLTERYSNKYMGRFAETVNVLNGFLSFTGAAKCALPARAC